VQQTIMRRKGGGERGEKEGKEGGGGGGGGGGARQTDKQLETEGMRTLISLLGYIAIQGSFAGNVVFFCGICRALLRNMYSRDLITRWFTAASDSLLNHHWLP